MQWSTEKSDAWCAPDGLGDFDVERCVDEMFLGLAPAPATALPPREPQRFRPMIAPRQTALATFPALPHACREELLGLCLEIVQIAKSQPLHTLMICGVERGVGASFVAQQLSRMLAEFSRLRIALLTVVSVQGQGVNNSRSSVVRREFDYLLVRTERPNLMEIASARGPVTLPELLGSGQTTAALRQMQQEFDFTVVDAPAVALHAEVALFAATLDGVILVAEQHATSLRQMDRAYSRLGKAQANVLGMVLNRQKIV